MTAAEHSAAAPRGERPAPAAPPLARRIAGWTSNLVAAALVLLVGLTLARQVRQWRLADQAASLVDAPLPLAPAAAPEDLDLAFGEQSAVLTRRIFRGDRSGVLAELAAACAASADQAPAPRGAVTSAEARMLASLPGRAPQRRSPGGDAVYALDGPWPLAAAVRATSASGGRPPRRVVCWGVALPRGSELLASRPDDGAAGEWTLFVCRAGDAAGAGPDPLPPPAGARRTLLVRQPEGGWVLGWAGPGPAEAWRASLDRAAERAGWRTVAAWQGDAQGWRARYQADGGAAVDVALAADADGGWRGLATAALPAEE